MEMDEPVLRIMERSTEDGASVLTVQGEIDMATTDTLEHRLEHACEMQGRVTVDLRRVSFLDCGGLRMMLDAHERAERRGCRVDFVQGPPAVRRVFELTGTLERVHFVEVAGRSHLAAASTG